MTLQEFVEENWHPVSYDTFRPNFLHDRQLITDHLRCRLVPGGRMIELDR